MFPLQVGEDAEFRREVIGINLRRIPWLLVASMLLTVGAIVALWGDSSARWLRGALMVDLASAGLLLALNSRVSCLPAASNWRPTYIWSTVVLSLAYMDGYYFLAARVFGQNPIYILGVVTAATVFLLPPKAFLPLLVGNHLLYCAILPSVAGSGAPLLPMVLQNTTGATVAGIVSVLLFRARREEYCQRRALAVANDSLQRRNRQLHDLMAITAHDLRSPLLGLRDLLSLARRPGPSGKAGEILKHADRSCSDLLTFVNRLLDVHAAEELAESAPPLELEDVRDLITTAAERIRIRGADRKISVTLDLPGTPVVLKIHRAILGQVLDNLLTNAVKFSPADSDIRVRLAEANGIWHCDVIDCGPGVSVEESVGLFQKFYQGTRAAESGEKGNGLGLYIAATLMRSMAGNIEYRSGNPCGSVFRVNFDQSEGVEG